MALRNPYPVPTTTAPTTGTKELSSILASLIASGATAPTGAIQTAAAQPAPAAVDAPPTKPTTGTVTMPTGLPPAPPPTYTPPAGVKDFGGYGGVLASIIASGSSNPLGAGRGSGSAGLNAAIAEARPVAPGISVSNKTQTRDTLASSPYIEGQTPAEGLMDSGQATPLTPEQIAAEERRKRLMAGQLAGGPSQLQNLPGMQAPVILPPPPLPR